MSTNSINVCRDELDDFGSFSLLSVAIPVLFYYKELHHLKKQGVLERGCGIYIYREREDLNHKTACSRLHINLVM